MEFVPLLVFGAFLSVIGILNIRGDVRSIHWYNRRRVRPEDLPRYGRAVGAGTLVAGAGILLTGILKLFIAAWWPYHITLTCLLIGLGLILYGQFRYNKGLF